MAENSVFQEYEPVVVGRQFRLQRQIGVSPSLPKALSDITRILSHELSIAPLRFAGLPERPINLDENSLAEWLVEFHEMFRRAELSQTFCLTDRRRDPAITLWLTADFNKYPIERNIEQIHFAQPEKFPLEALISAIGQMHIAFGSFYGYTWDSLLALLHGRNMRSYEIALSKLPPDEQHCLSKPLPFEGVTDNLPPLLLRWEFDDFFVPEGVWWINVWSKTQVDTVGLERIQTANWSRIVEQPDGSLLLVATEEPTDMRNPAHMRKVGEIVEHLSLRERQEQFRLKPTNSFRR